MEKNDGLVPDAPRVPNLQRLLDVGFERVGSWMASPFKSGGIDFVLTKEYPSNVIYAFAIRNYVNYVGVTDRGLARRFTAYANPGPCNKTDWSVCKQIKACTEMDREDDRWVVEIYAWFDQDKSQIGEFYVDRCYSF